MNALDMAERETVLGLLRLGWSIRRVCRETGHRHETVRRYGYEAGLLAPRSAAKPHTQIEVPADPESPTLSGQVPTDSAGATRSRCEPYRAFIEAELAKRRNAKAIYQDLVEHHGYTGSYDAVKRFARKLSSEEPRVRCRFESDPGQDYVEYGVMLRTAEDLGSRADASAPPQGRTLDLPRFRGHKDKPVNDGKGCVQWLPRDPSRASGRGLPASIRSRRCA